MNYAKYLTAAGVEPALQPAAIKSLEQAKAASSGLTWSKWKTRLFKNKKIADLLSWEDERLCTKYPELQDWDIAPMYNITAHGDNVPWDPKSQRPVPGVWMDKNPESEEYKFAVSQNYWLPGTHPRSKESRAAWYRRNAGEFKAWRLGENIDLAHGVRVWRSEGFTVYSCGEAWQIIGKTKVLGFIPLNIRIGYEISNLWIEGTNAQAWYPIENHPLKAPVTWYVMPLIG